MTEDYGELTEEKGEQIEDNGELTSITRTKNNRGELTHNNVEELNEESGELTYGNSYVSPSSG